MQDAPPERAEADPLDGIGAADRLEDCRASSARFTFISMMIRTSR